MLTIQIHYVVTKSCSQGNIIILIIQMNVFKVKSNSNDSKDEKNRFKFLNDIKI
jgi:hypothetical protein